MRRYEGNYSKFLEQKILEERNNEKKGSDESVQDSGKKNVSEIKLKPKAKSRLSFKEVRELKELDLKLPLLEAQKISLEKKITERGLDINDISNQLAALVDSIKEYEDRWIELSEMSESGK